MFIIDIILYPKPTPITKSITKNSEKSLTHFPTLIHSPPHSPYIRSSLLPKKFTFLISPAQQVTLASLSQPHARTLWTAAALHCVACSARRARVSIHEPPPPPLCIPPRIQVARASRDRLSISARLECASFGRRLTAGNA